MYLDLPSFSEHSRNLNSILSPRVYQHDAREKLQYQSPSQRSTDSKKCIEAYQQTPILLKTPEAQQQKYAQNQINGHVKAFEAMTNSRFSQASQMRHSRSLTSENQQNKFYSFKKIREEKCKELIFASKVIKSMKVDQQNQKPQRKKIIEHLDEIKTIQSKNSPRSSLNSLVQPQIQESLIIMKGADLYDDLMKQNNAGKSKFFQDSRLQNPNFQTPLVRKGLCQSSYWMNHDNMAKNNYTNCMTDPKKLRNEDEKGQISDDERRNIHNFLRHMNTMGAQNNNKLSFLKAKKLQKRF